jgi:hypothetical protein
MSFSACRVCFQSLLQQQGSHRLAFYIVVSGKVRESQPLLLRPSASRFEPSVIANANARVGPIALVTIRCSFHCGTHNCALPRLITRDLLWRRPRQRSHFGPQTDSEAVKVDVDVGIWGPLEVIGERRFVEEDATHLTNLRACAWG